MSKSKYIFEEDPETGIIYRVKNIKKKKFKKNRPSNDGPERENLDYINKNRNGNFN